MSKGLRSDKMNSPWGVIDSVEKTPISGVTFVSTPSHGGYRVTVNRAKEMRVCLLDLAIDYGSRYYWFEEDCNYVAVLLTWPEIDADRLPDIVTGFDVPTSVRRATNLKILRHWNPDTYKVILGLGRREGR